MDKGTLDCFHMGGVGKMFKSYNKSLNKNKHNIYKTWFIRPHSRKPTHNKCVLSQLSHCFTTTDFWLPTVCCHESCMGEEFIFNIV